MASSQPAYLTYQEVQELRPIFEYYSKSGQWKALRRDANILLRDMKMVRDQDYSPLRGMQLWLPRGAWQLLEDVRTGTEPAD